MKKLLAICFAATLISCGDETTETKEETKNEAAPVAEESSDYKEGLALVGKSDCFTCHKVSEVSVGPSYEAIAAKYEVTDAVMDTLAKKIIKGGSGRWGSVPMTPHPQISEADAKTMLKYIMSLKK